MDDKKFFGDIINAVPKRCYNSGVALGVESVLDKERAGLLDASLQPEIDRLRFYLMNRDRQDREIIIEWITNNLLHGYYETREMINIADSLALKNDIRRIMNVIYEATIMVILLSEEIRVVYNSEFIGEWASRVAYFPFKNLMKIDENGCSNIVQTDVLRFSNIVNERTCVRLLRSLTDGRFIQEDTTMEDIMYWFGGSNTVVANRINWIAKLKDLNVFINTFYTNELKQWEKAVVCFTWKGGGIKIKSLSTAIAKHDSDPESKVIFEAIRKEIR